MAKKKPVWQCDIEAWFAFNTDGSLIVNRGGGGIRGPRMASTRRGVLSCSPGAKKLRLIARVEEIHKRAK
jgi:hypothetical protein